MNKAFIFAAGFVVGGVIGTTLTVLAYQKEKKKWAEGKEEPKPATHEDAISTTPEELRYYYIDQLRNLGFEVIDTEEDNYDNYFASSSVASSVNPIDDEEEEDEEGDDNCYPVEPNPIPFEIVNREFGTLEFYDSESLIWYRGDGVMCDADDLEMIDDWQQHIGDVEGRLNGCRGDELYFRNEVEQTDYSVKICEDSYKHAVEGEEDGEDV